MPFSKFFEPNDEGMLFNGFWYFKPRTHGGESGHHNDVINGLGVHYSWSDHSNPFFFLLISMLVSIAIFIFWRKVYRMCVVEFCKSEKFFRECYQKDPRDPRQRAQNDSRTSYATKDGKNPRNDLRQSPTDGVYSPTDGVYSPTDGVVYSPTDGTYSPTDDIDPTHFLNEEIHRISDYLEAHARDPIPTSSGSPLRRDSAGSGARPISATTTAMPSKRPDWRQHEWGREVHRRRRLKRETDIQAHIERKYGKRVNVDMGDDDSSCGGRSENSIRSSASKRNEKREEDSPSSDRGATISRRSERKKEASLQGGRSPKRESPKRGGVRTEGNNPRRVSKDAIIHPSPMQGGGSIQNHLSYMREAPMREVPMSRAPSQEAPMYGNANSAGVNSSNCPRQTPREILQSQLKSPARGMRSPKRKSKQRTGSPHPGEWSPVRDDNSIDYKQLYYDKYVKPRKARGESKESADVKERAESRKSPHAKAGEAESKAAELKQNADSFES